ncbi:MAG: hypothetical protein WCR42_05570 [bacterium]
MKLYRIIILIFILSTYSLSAQIWTDVTIPEITDASKGYSGNEIVTDIVKDNSGNYYITGHFDGRLVFGSDTINAVDGYDIFVAKADKDRNWLWVTSATGKSADYSNSISLDGSGNAYIAGYFNDDLTFGSTTIYAANKDLFVAKISSAGVWQWAKKAGGTYGDEAYSIKTDSDGTSYVTGLFKIKATFGSYSVTSNSSSIDIFVAKINSSGTWQWVRRAGGTLKDQGTSLDMDTKYIYICGYFAGTADFGTNTVVSKGSYDAFTAKISKNGDWIWVKPVGGAGMDLAEAISYNSGRLYYTGSFSGDADFITETVTSEGSTDAFFAVVDTVGTNSWVKTAGGTQDDSGYDVFSYSTYIYFSGTYSDYIDFNGTSYESNGGDDIFIASYTTDGTFNMVSTGGSEGDDKLGGSIEIATGQLYHIGTGAGLIKFGSKTVNTLEKSDIFEAIQYAAGSWKSINVIPSAILKSEVKSIATDGDGNKYVIGYYYGELKFGSTTLQSTGGSDIFIAKCAYDGTWIWAISAGGQGDDIGYDLAISSAGDIYIAGSYYGQASFGSTDMTSAGIEDAYVAKLNSSAEFQWVRSGGGIDFDVARAIKINSKGEIFLAGNFYEEADFGAINVTSRGMDDIFTAKITSAGNWKWIKTAGGEDNEEVYDLAIDKNDKLYVVGSLFNGGYFGSILVTSKGNDDSFLAKADTNGTWLAATGCGSAEFNEKAYSVFVDDSLNCYIGGQFTGLAYFGSMYLYSDAAISGYLAKLNPSLEYKTVEKFGSTGENKILSIMKDKDKFYLAGQFENTISLAGKSYTSKGKKDIFVLCKDSLLKNLYAYTAGGTGNDKVNSIATYKDGEDFLAGNFASKASFGDIVVSTPSAYDNIAFVAKNDFVPAPPPWELPELTDNFATVLIPTAINPKINGRAFEKGDAVGIFYKSGKTLICVGYTIYMKKDISIKVRGDNHSTSAKDGISDYDKYIFKLWDGKKQRDTIGYINIKSGPRRYIKSATTEVENLPIINDSIEIQLYKGWNLMSSYIDPKFSLADSVFKKVSALVIAKSVSGSFYLKTGSSSVNTIGDYDERVGYAVFMTADEKFKIYGDRINSIYDPVKLSYGWNIMGVSTDDVMEIDTLFNDAKYDITIVKDNVGKFYIPFGFKNLSYINPKQAYKVYMKNERILYFPDNE